MDYQLPEVLLWKLQTKRTLIFGDPDDRIARTKLFRRKSLEDNQFRFQKDHRDSEDLEFVMDCLIAANTFAT